MSNQINMLTAADFPMYDHQTGKIIADELNVLLRDSLDSDKVLTLRADLISSPDLYLSDETIRAHEIIKFDK